MDAPEAQSSGSTPHSTAWCERSAAARHAAPQNSTAEQRAHATGARSLQDTEGKAGKARLKGALDDTRHTR